MFVITTDGMENASREFTYEQVRRLIEQQKNKYGWEFIFLGANIDAIAVADRFGISEDRAANFHADSNGTLLNFAVISEAVSELRAGRPIARSGSGVSTKTLSSVRQGTMRLRGERKVSCGVLT